MDKHSSGEEENFEDKEFLQGRDLSKVLNLGRPPLPKMNPSKDKVEFMQIDIDYYTAVPPSKFSM